MDLLCTIKKRDYPTRYVAFIAGERVARAPTLTETANLARVHIRTCYTQRGIPVSVTLKTPNGTTRYRVSALGITQHA